MLSGATNILLWFLSVGCGVMAGLYFAFSSFIMTALARSGQASGVAAMNAINAVILRSAFMPLFWGTSLGALAAAIIGAMRWGEQSSWLLLAGGTLYFAGMTIVTALRNVPLNNALAAADPQLPASAAIWSRYLDEWTKWNHVRTAASTLASILFIAALAAD